MTATIYTNNRRKLANRAKDADYIIVGGNALLSKSSDVNFNFRQDSNILYLTGLEIPSLSILIDKFSDKHILVIPKRSQTQQFFEGTVSNQELLEASGCDEAIYYQDLAKKVKNKKVYYNLPPKTQNWGLFSNPFRAWLKKYLASYGATFIDIRKELAELRMVKQDYELDSIRNSVDITKRTLNVLESRLWSSNHTELSLANEIIMSYLKEGSAHGYPPIVAFGANASTLHHNPTLAQLNKSEIVLIDTGAETNHYSADISRTFTKSRDPIYGDIIGVQQQIISQIKPGLTLKDLHNQAVKLLQEIAKKHHLDQPIESLFPHAIGHHLGLDVHDPADYQVPLCKNMVITIEPGLYSKQAGFGYRIEDNILITNDGAIIL